MTSPRACKQRVVLELPWSPRRLAAVSFLSPARLSFAILFVFWVTPEPAPRDLLFVLDTQVLFAIAFAVLLLSRRALARAAQPWLLGLVVVVCLESLLAAPVWLLGWIVPLWFVVQHYRSTDMSS